MIMWKKTTSDGGFFNIETIRVTTSQISITESGYKYVTVMSSENGTETVDYYKTEADADAGHADICRKLGLK